MEKIVKIHSLHEEHSDLSYWLNKSPEQRLSAVETLRLQYVRFKFWAKPALQDKFTVTRITTQDFYAPTQLAPQMLCNA